MRKVLAVGLLTMVAAACGDTTGPAEPALDATAQDALASQHNSAAPGAVYLMSNADGPNEVLVYDRGPDGALTARESVPTGGLGTGAGLGNQSALAMTANGRLLLVVNPGSDDVSVFGVHNNGLRLLDREPSGGSTPISVTVHRNVVYVLNGGSPNSIHGFWLSPHGELEPIPGSWQPLSQDQAGPAQIGFHPNGRYLVVTEKATNQILTYSVGWDGVASPPEVHASAGATPFGFAFNRWGSLVVSEAEGGAPDAATVSLYWIGHDGGFYLLDGQVPTTESAACWVAIPYDGRHAYTTNTGSGSVTGFQINRRDLDILDPDGETGLTGMGSRPIDAAFSRNSRYLYVLDSGTNEISGFLRDGHGGLEPIEGATGLPASANGMAVR